MVSSRREHVREALVATSIGVAVVFLMFFGRAQAFSWRLTGYGALIGLSIFVCCRLLYSLVGEPLNRREVLPRSAVAAAEYEHVRQVTGAPTAGQAVTYARMGKPGEARKILEVILEAAGRRYVSPETVAAIYANLGEKEQSFVWLDKAYLARSGSLPVMFSSPAYDPIRADPRFTALQRKMGMEK